MEEIKNSQLAIIENGNYQEIENLLTQVEDINNGDILIPLAKRKDICIKLIENEKLPETTIREFLKDCSFEEFLLIISRSPEYLNYGMLCDCCNKKEYLQQIVQSNNTEHILHITRLPTLPLNIQIYILISGNDELIRPYLEYNDEFDEAIQKIIIFSKNKKWYQWALKLDEHNSKMYVEPSDAFEDEIIKSGDEEIISFAIDVCLLSNPMKIIELNNPKLIENLVRSFPYEAVTSWIIKNKREDLLSIMIEEHFLNDRLPEALLKFKKHKFMQQYIEKLQNYATEQQVKYQKPNKCLDHKGLQEILKYYEIPYKRIDKEYISLILK